PEDIVGRTDRSVRHAVPVPAPRRRRGERTRDRRRRGSRLRERPSGGGGGEPQDRLRRAARWSAVPGVGARDRAVGYAAGEPPRSDLLRPIVRSGGCIEGGIIGENVEPESFMGRAVSVARALVATPPGSLPPVEEVFPPPGV